MAPRQKVQVFKFAIANNVHDDSIPWLLVVVVVDCQWLLQLLLVGWLLWLLLVAAVVVGWLVAVVVGCCSCC